MGPFKSITVTGCTESLDMRLLAHVTGLVGMERLPNNYVLVVFFTMNTLIHATGPRMLKDAKSIVSLSHDIRFHVKTELIVLSFHSNPSLALCNDDANGNVPLGKSCNRYWQCQGGYPRLQRCPAMLVFDRRSLRCVVPPTEDCDVPTTQTPPEGEYQDNGNIPSRGNNNAGSQQDHQRQLQEDEDDGIVPHLLLNTFSHSKP